MFMTDKAVSNNVANFLLSTRKKSIPVGKIRNRFGRFDIDNINKKLEKFGLSSAIHESKVLINKMEKNS